MKMLSALIGVCILATVYAQGRSAFICEVFLDNFCPNNDATCASDPKLTFGSSTYGMGHFNLLSFDSFYAKSGDVEGRVAVRNNIDVTSYSFGYELKTGGISAWDTPLPYSIVVGHDAKWNGGAAYPLGNNIPYQGAKEYIFVGGDFSQASSYLQADRTGSCNGIPGCLDSDFDAAQAYYKDLSNAFNALTPNAQIAIESWGTATLTCNSMADAQYVIRVTPNQFSLINFWTTVNCNKKSGLIVNIVGAGNSVRFWGATQTSFANQKTLYNVVPTASTPSVRVEVGVNGNLLAPTSNYNQPGLGVFIGQVIVGNVQETLQVNLIFCAPPLVNNHNNSNNKLCPAWETDCAGLSFNLDGSTFNGRDFNAIIFGDYTVDTGDIQGRLAVQGNARFGNGYSVGDQLQTATGTVDKHLSYSLIVGRDLSWGSGALYPNGDGIPYPGMKENMFVGGTFTTNQTDLNDRRTGGPTATPGALDNTFNAVKTCYTGYSNAIANHADNVQHNIEFAGLSVTCNDASASDYYLSLTPTEFTQFTYTTVGNCNFQARWYINIRGTGDVEITGDSFPAIPGGTVYNVIGCGRTAYIHDTALAGAFLAPCSTLNNPKGVIYGKVVAGAVVASNQINRQDTCPQPVNVTVPVVIIKPSVHSTYGQFSNDFVNEGDVVDGLTVVATHDDNVYEFNAPADWAAGQVLKLTISSSQSRVSETKADSPSSASVVSMTLAVVLAFVALAF